MRVSTCLQVFLPKFDFEKENAPLVQDGWSDGLVVFFLKIGHTILLGGFSYKLVSFLASVLAS